MKNKKTIGVAISGGVDSSVAAALLKQQGYDVFGVTMCFHIPKIGSKKAACCGVSSIEDAREAARILDIEHHVLDYVAEMDEYIMDDFINEYLNGRTPNPCVRCNQYLKFQRLFEDVKGLGGEAMATGHYVKNEFNETLKQFELKKAKDPKKDQSYFLYSTPKELLPNILFPLGGFTKDEIRVLAKDFNLNTAEKPESQDICFVPDEGYKKFLEDRLGTQVLTPGEFKDQDGKVVGQHKGIAHYTIGQREQLGIALGRRVYVCKIDKETNTVWVGDQEYLYSHGLLASKLSLTSCENLKENQPVTVKIRYNAPEVEAFVLPLEDGKIKVDFKKPQKSVTPGQSVVLFDGDVVLGGAVIDSKIGGENEC